MKLQHQVSCKSFYGLMAIYYISESRRVQPCKAIDTPKGLAISILLLSIKFIIAWNTRFHFFLMSRICANNNRLIMIIHRSFVFKLIRHLLLLCCAVCCVRWWSFLLLFIIQIWTTHSFYYFYSCSFQKKFGLLFRSLHSQTYQLLVFTWNLVWPSLNFNMCICRKNVCECKHAQNARHYIQNIRSTAAICATMIMLLMMSSTKSHHKVLSPVTIISSGIIKIALQLATFIDAWGITQP